MAQRAEQEREGKRLVYEQFNRQWRLYYAAELKWALQDYMAQLVNELKQVAPSRAEQEVLMGRPDMQGMEFDLAKVLEAQQSYSQAAAELSGILAKAKVVFGDKVCEQIRYFETNQPAVSTTKYDLSQVRTVVKPMSALIAANQPITNTPDLVASISSITVSNMALFMSHDEWRHLKSLSEAMLQEIRSH